MGLVHAGLLFLLCCSAYRYAFSSGAGYGPFVQDPELEWARMETVIDEERTQAPAPRAQFKDALPEAKKVPQYRIVSTSKDQKALFKPEKGSRPLPNSVKSMLLVTAAPETEGGQTTRRKLVEILCHVDRMYVRIRREVFKTTDAYKYLKLGTCPVNQGTKAHYYLLYLLKNDCGYKRESNADYLSISNVLRYNPTGPILREMPFNIPLQCKYPRLFHSYKVGFYPILKGGTVYKALQPKSSFMLTSQDASGNEITGAKTYTLGQLMYFEAKRPDNTASSGDQRMYINKCFMTASQDPNSSPKYAIIDNQGCMIDGKLNAQSKFLTGSSKMTQRFSVGAFIFKDTASSSSTQQLYMHCDISLGKLTPTPSSKACSYDPATKKWKELYGDDSVCACCESSCSSSQPRASRNMVSGPSWTVDLSRKDGPVEFYPRMKSFDTDTDTFSLEDPDMAEHKDFLNFWDHDY
ncbi:zona pellucida sperm-binding protein 3 [Thunnus albacares]|uniref:zona pellucida sperm-binding protein 3 n=1 Tax=Thunnus albacares TaxID=8236 RepID=UPI001CF65FFA|nr:zona pellucida sperm-binding protein 3 [Thunnus albacares]